MGQTRIVEEGYVVQVKVERISTATSEVYDQGLRRNVHIGEKRISEVLQTTVKARTAELARQKVIALVKLIDDEASEPDLDAPE